MQIAWTSVSNEVYEVDEADALIDTNTGSITWNKIYDQYPSQGTNTFWLDTGNYNYSPQILHPKDTPTRFYRIVDLGPDSTSDEPTIVINTPTNSTLASSELSITVTATTDQPVLSGTKLYVDGQEMQVPDSTTNYTDSTGVTNYEVDTYSINTCEWFNGNHILFATTECASGRGDTLGSGTIAVGHGVSPFVTVLFNNLVEDISFSQPSFDPASGQTQQVSAVFALDSDWTLNVVDAFSNVVFTTNGSGISMNYNWDGNGTGGVSLPAGIYFYYIDAATNGLTPDVVLGGGGSSPPSPDFESSELWAASPDSESVVPLALYPPGFDTNNLTIFSATPSEVRSLTVTSVRTTGFSAMASPDDSGSDIGDPGYVTPLPNPQNPPWSPQRPPNNPFRGSAGTFGVAYDTYSANGGTNPVYCAILGNGLPGNTGYISMQGNSASSPLPFAPLKSYIPEVNNFVSQMQYWGWKNSFLKADNQLSISDLRGSGTPFNSVNIGVLFTHGVYGSSIDYAANQCKQMYFPITSGGSAQYLRLSEMNLGGSGTNGLKWMALNSCHSLYQANWSSMKNAGIYPYNSSLHLLMGENSDGYTSSTFGWYWAKYINWGTGTNATSYSPLPIGTAWFQAAYDAYHSVSFPSGTTITYAVAGDSACQNDTLQTNSTPAGSWFYTTKQVFPLLQ